MNLPFLRRAKVCFSLLATFSLIIPAFAPSTQAQQSQRNNIVSLAPGQIAPSHPLTNKFTVNDSGSLAVIGPKGKVSAHCPLKHTAVSAQISGYVSRVTVKQLFSNPFKDKI